MRMYRLKKQPYPRPHYALSIGCLHFSVWVCQINDTDHLLFSPFTHITSSAPNNSHCSLTTSPIAKPRNNTMVLYYFLFAALAGSAVYLSKQLSPKMLIYRLRVRPIPTIVKTKSGRFKVALEAKVNLFNENLLHLDVHAISFDIYMPNHNQKEHLRHLASVHDTDYVHLVSEENRNSTALWSVPAQSHFNTTTKMGLSIRPWATVRSTWRLFQQLIGSGHLELPTTGVAHIRATAAQNYSALPFTITIACDNRVNLRLGGVEILGRDCVMKQMTPGWLDLLETAEQLRNTSVMKALA